MIRKCYIIYLITFIITGYFYSCKEEKSTTIKQTKISFKKEGELSVFKKQTDTLKAVFDIEIANNDYEIQTGLMYRDAMKSNRGMLFIFDDEIERFFYMKNTHIPLDIIFINQAKRIVSFKKEAKPFDETTIPSNVAAKYVLEINAGQIDNLSLEVGDSINF